MFIKLVSSSEPALWCFELSPLNVEGFARCFEAVTSTLALLQVSAWLSRSQSQQRPRRRTSCSLW